MKPFSMTSARFDVTQTNIAKGVACLLLLFHHLFYNSEEYYSLFTPFMANSDGVPLACLLAPFGKVCVCIFLILSGYGVNTVLNKQLASSSQSHPFLAVCRTSWRILWKMMAGFWLLYLLFVPWQSLMGHQPYTAWYQIPIDFFGLARLFGTPTMNATWWYLSAAILCYLFTPVFKWLIQKAKGLCAAAILASMLVMMAFSMTKTAGSIPYYILVYVAGMLISEFDVLNHLQKYRSSNWFYLLLITGGLVLAAVVWRRADGALADPFYAISLILFSYLILSRIPCVNRFLAFFGKHSGNIFMFHTFLFLYDFQWLVYAPKYAPLIYVCFVVVCLLISMLLEQLKKWIHFPQFVQFVGNKIAGT